MPASYLIFILSRIGTQFLDNRLATRLQHFLSNFGFIFRSGVFLKPKSQCGVSKQAEEWLWPVILLSCYKPDATSTLKSGLRIKCYQTRTVTPHTTTRSLDQEYKVRERKGTHNSCYHTENQTWARSCRWRRC